VSTPFDGSDITKLVNSVQTVLPNLSVALAVRSENGAFLYVNDEWEKYYGHFSEGETIYESSLLSAAEISHFNAIDSKIGAERKTVNVLKYKNSRIIDIRVLIFFSENNYLITASWPLSTNYSTIYPFGWSSERTDIALAEAVADRLLILSSTPLVGLEKAAADLQDMLSTVRAAIKAQKEK
jgi:hypothetical protein